MVYRSLDVVDRDEPKYQIRNPYELTNAIIATDERCNDCFLLHSTVLAQSSDEILEITYGTKDSILHQPDSIGHCKPAEVRNGKGFSQLPIPQNPWCKINMPQKKRFSSDNSTPSGSQLESLISTSW